MNNTLKHFYIAKYHARKHEETAHIRVLCQPLPIPMEGDNYSWSRVISNGTTSGMRITCAKCMTKFIEVQEAKIVELKKRLDMLYSRNQKEEGTLP